MDEIARLLQEINSTLAGIREELKLTREQASHQQQEEMFSSIMTQLEMQGLVSASPLIVPGDKR